MYKIKVKILVMLGLKWKYQEEFLSYFFSFFAYLLALSMKNLEAMATQHP